MKPAVLAVSLFALSFLGLSQASAANLLTNGSFEDGTFVNDGNGGEALNGGSTAIDGWTQTGNQAIYWLNTHNNYGAGAQDGSYFLDLTGGAGGYGDALGQGISQTISTTKGDKYLLSFYLGSSAQYGIEDGLTVTSNATLLGGPTFTSTNGTSGNENLWELETLSLIATGPSTTITFTGASGPHYIGLDNADLELTGVAAAVPEPSTWATILLGVGLVGGGLRMARRKSAMALTAA